MDVNNTVIHGDLTVTGHLTYGIGDCSITNSVDPLDRRLMRIEQHLGILNIDEAVVNNNETLKSAYDEYQRAEATVLAEKTQKMREASSEFNVVYKLITGNSL